MSAKPGIIVLGDAAESSRWTEEDMEKAKKGTEIGNNLLIW